MRKQLIVSIVAALAATTLVAQTQPGGGKLLSPPATAEGSIAGKKIVVHYSAPSMRGRTIMGGLVPWDKVWRTGANAATTLITQADLRIGDLEVPRGTYTLYTIPGEGQWRLIINKQTGQWGTQYDETQDLGRTPMQFRELETPVELFTIKIAQTSGNAGVLKLIWETTEVRVPIVVVE